MNALKNKGLLVLAASTLLTLAACAPAASSSEPAPSSRPSSEPSSSEPAPASSKAEFSTIPYVPQTGETYVREADEDVFNRVMGKFAYDYDGAKAIADDSERFVAYARAEATLLESGVMAITTTRGGTYSMSRIAPRTAPYVFFGNDSDKIKGHILTAGADSFIKGSERAELIELWKKAAAGEGEYDPAAYLTGKGYTLGTEYATTFSTPNATFDSLATSMQADTEQMVNCYEGLVQYDNFGVLSPAMAESWESNEDLTKWTFHIRKGAKWYNSDRRAVADVTADDFVAGFQHMLDAAGGLEWIVEGVVKGVSEYLYEGGSFDDVGCYVDDNGDLVFELEAPESFFATRLTYSCFLPMNRAYFIAHGGEFGVDEFAEAKTGISYEYGTSMNRVLYNGAFIPTTWDENSSLVITKNENYWDAEHVYVTKATWNYDDGSNPQALYAAARAGTYPGIGLGEASGLLQQSKDDGLFDDYHFVTDTDATTYFGGLNLNRGAYVNTNDNAGCPSAQTEEAKILTHNLMQDQNFRRAIMHGWDRGTWNAISVGEDLKYNSLRNLYTQPEFVTLAKEVKVGDLTFAQGASYGEVVQQILDADGETNIKVADGQDGWYNPEYATQLMAKARQDNADIWAADKKVEIDMVYLSTSVSNTATANAFKQLLETQFPNDVQINLIAAANTTEYYAAGYRAPNGAAENQDIFYGSGWGPDYGDPSTYLDTFAAGGYMLKVLGLF